MGFDGLHYELTDDYDEDALLKKSRIRDLELESRTILLDQYDDGIAFAVAAAAPARDFEVVFQELSNRARFDVEFPFFAAGPQSGYWIVESGSLFSVSELQELLYLPLVGAYGKPTSIINASERSAITSEAERFAQLHAVQYTDVHDQDHVGLPLGRLRA